MTNHIETRDFDANRSTRSRDGGRSLLDDDVSLMSEVAEGIIERDRRRMRREVIRYISFGSAVLSCLCGGSITAFSLYAPYFQTDLHYNQLRINAVSITAELAMYLPVPFLGYLCDRYSPPPLSLVASVFFGAGYLLAAFTYKSGPPADTGYGDGWPFWVMILAFVGVGIGTSAMYLSAVATCAKNFGKSKHAGLVLAVPISAFGLSGMWQSQLGAHLLYRKGPKGEHSRDLDVFKYFIFLACTLSVVALIGAFALRIVGEEDLIDERVEELERSGMLEESDFFNPRNSHGHTNGYGTINGEQQGDQSDDDTSSAALDLTESMILAKQKEAEAREQEQRKKTWLLNLETRRFLSDPTMWYLAAGFFLVTGPGEAYINNLGTIISTLTPTDWTAADPPAGTASTHVSTIAVTSTFARLLTGTLSDLLAPRASSTPKPTDADSDTTPLSPTPHPHNLKGVSRLYLLFASSLLLLLCFLSLTLIVPSTPKLFPLSSALLGLGYGASFSLVPIIISVVWGVENFATNWGVIALMPAGGAAVWSAVYAVGYAEAAKRGNQNIDRGDGEQCFGAGCFIGWGWGCAASVLVAMVLFAGAWGRWRARGVVV